MHDGIHHPPVRYRAVTGASGEAEERIRLVWFPDGPGLWNVSRELFPSFADQMSAVLGPSAARLFLTDLRQTLTDRVPVAVDYATTDAQGVAHWVRHTIMPGEDNEAFGALEDASGMRSVPLSSHYRMDLLDHLPLKIIRLTPDLEVTWANQTARDTFIEWERHYGRKCHKTAFNYDEPCPSCPVVRARETGRVQTVEYTLPDGQTFSIIGVPRYDADGNLESLTEVAQDITEAARARVDRERHHRDLTEIVAALDEGLCVFGADRRVRHVNPRMAEMLGLAPDAPEFATMDESSFAHRLSRDMRDPDSFSRLAGRARRGARGFLGREELVDGRTLSFSVEWLPATTDRAHCPVWCVRDETAHQRLALAVEANRTKDRFLSTMSHEVRTPLNGILGMLDLLSATSLDTDQAECLRSMRRSGEDLVKVLDNILFYATLESERVALRPQSFDPCALARALVDAVAPATADRPIDLRVECAPDMPERYEGDPDAVRRILFNLVDNGLKFTVRGRVVVSVSGVDGALRLTVEDTGRGIGREAVRHLFTPFRQAEEGTVRSHDGTGLGLVIARRLAQMMGGDIEVESHPNEGSVFTVTLPLSAAAAADSVIPDVLRGARALVVVSDDETRVALMRALTRAKMIVDTATGAAEGRIKLRRARTEGYPYLAVVVEEALPRGGMGGFIRVLDRETLQDTSFFAAVPAGAFPPTIPECKGVLPCPGQERFWWSTLAAAFSTVPLSKRATAPRLPAIPDLPTLGRASAPATPPVEGDEAKRLRGKRILIVEDNKTNRLVLQRMLVASGAVVEEAENGREGVDQMRSHPYDAVIMDCHMPVMDGYEATEAIRRHESETGEPRRRILALTASAIAGDRERCLAAGMDEYLTKPIGREALVRALEG